jgi:hypothetical protein
LEQVDWALEYLTRKWASVPEYARLWSAEWDDIGKVDFEMEWAIPRSWLAKLDHWVEQGRLTPEQRRRHDDLSSLIERMRPTLERLLAP